MNKYQAFKDLYGSTLLLFSKEELIQMIAIYNSCYYKMGETCVEESKDHIKSSGSIDKIKDYLNEIDFKFYDEKSLRRKINGN